MKYVEFYLDQINGITLAHHFLCKSYDSGLREMPGIELMIAENGCWEIEISGEKYSQYPGQIVILPLNVPHRVYTSADSRESSHYALHFTCDSSILNEQQYSNQFEINNLRNPNIHNNHKIILPIIIDCSNKQQIQAQFQHLLQEFYGEKPYGYSMASVLLQHLLIQIARNHFLQVLQTPENIRGKRSNLLFEVMQYINKHYDTITSIQDIAKEMCVNTNYLGNVFKNNMGISIVQYLTKVRIEHAKMIIEAGEYSYQEIAQKVGVENYYYFSTLFKKYVGITMSQYQSILR